MKLFVGIILTFFTQSIAGQNASEIVRAADAKMRGTTSQAFITVITVRPTWSREMKVKTWIKGSDLAMILVLAPAKDKGITFLKRQKEVWNWIPALEKVIKFPPSMMAQSWMGTDFSNDDLVRESSIVNDYTHEMIGDTIIENRSCHIIRLIPKADAAVVWGKLLLYIDKKDFLELYTLFYDEDGSLINTMTATDIRQMDGRLIPTRFEMIPADKPNQKTVLIYQSVLYNRPLEDGFFTTEKMKSLNE